MLGLPPDTLRQRLTREENIELAGQYQKKGKKGEQRKKNLIMLEGDRVQQRNRN